MKPSPQQLARWRRDPCGFIEECLIDPETSKPFKLFPAQRSFLDYAWRTGADGRLLYPEQVYAAPKKSGKTGFAALHMLATVLLHGGRFAEGYALANDQEQAQGRVFQAIARIVECSPLLRDGAEIMRDTIRFPVFSNATISAIASDYAGAAGANPTISCFDELWGYTSERSRRLWDEMVPPPTRKIACRLTVTYAGFSGESVLLEELHKRGMAQPEVGPSLHAGDGILMAWHTAPIAPWQTTSWLADMRRTMRTESVPASDPEPVCDDRVVIHRHGELGRLCRHFAAPGSRGPVTAGVRRRRCVGEARFDRDRCRDLGCRSPEG